MNVLKKSRLNCLKALNSICNKRFKRSVNSDQKNQFSEKRVEQSQTNQENKIAKFDQKTKSQESQILSNPPSPKKSKKRNKKLKIIQQDPRTQQVQPRHSNLAQ